MGSIRPLPILTLLLLPRLALAYPIPPQPLWRLLERAERVVLAEVEALETLEGEEAKVFHGTVARLRVLETWVGEPAAEVSVSFSPTMVCPAPARYVEGRTVLAFLARRDASEPWSTVGLSYGTLYLRQDELPVWREAVAEGAALLARGTVSEDERRRWHVLRAARAATRWHGIYPLDQRADRMHALYDDREGGPVTLTPEEQRVLAEGLVAEPQLDSNLIGMLERLREHRSEAVDAIAASAVMTVLDEDRSPYFLDRLVELSLARWGLKPGPAPLEQWKAAARERHPGGVAPLPTPPPPPVAGVGADTPD